MVLSIARLSLFVWKFFFISLFPLLVWGYCSIYDIEFTRFDEGFNQHKVFIFVMFCVSAYLWRFLYLRLKYLLQRNRTLS